jgi:hypothetical protein
MKNVVQEILNNIRRAQKIYEINSQVDLQQSRTTTKYPRECEEASPFGGTGMNNKVVGDR